MNLRIFDTLEDLTAAAAREIARLAQDGTSVALSGGSSPAPLYAILGQDAALRERTLTWVAVDERCVPREDPRSNAGMIDRTLFASGIAPRHRFLRFRTELVDPAATAREFEREWSDLALTRLDVVLLGVGEDGHTASLFPGTGATEVEDRIATEVFVPELDAWRVTITRPVIRAAGLRIVLASGEGKREVVLQARAGADLPIVAATAGDIATWWFVDRAAVG